MSRYYDKSDLKRDLVIIGVVAFMYFCGVLVGSSL
jgi:hypothetical protein